MAVLAGAAGALSPIPTAPVLQAMLLTVFSLAGIGSAALCWLALPGPAATAGVIGLSMAGVIALATSMNWLKIWAPTPSCVMISVLVTAVGLLRLWQLRNDSDIPTPSKTVAAQNVNFGLGESVRPPRLGGITGPFVVPSILIVALCIWALALPGLRRVTAGQWGLLFSQSGVLLLLALVLTVTGFVVAIVVHREIMAAVAILVALIVDRVTVPMITEVPIYTWTYKHIGIVDYILKNHALPPTGVDVYNQWPGFFAGMAWFSSITKSDLDVTAHWFGIVSDALLIVLVAALALSFNASIRSALVAGMLALLVNWVGQDYYSPQATAIVLCASVLVLLSCSRSLPAAGYVSVPVFAVLVPTHQLTPLWVVAVTVALAVLKQLRPRWLALVYLAILAAYLIPRHHVILQNGGLASFNPFNNTKAVGQGRGSDGRVFSVIIEQGLSMSVWVGAAVCFVLIWRRGRPPWELALVAFSPLALILGLNYGGEAILRVFLYSLLGSCALVAPFITRALDYRPPQRIGVLILAWLAMTIAAAAGMQGYYGSWTYITITRHQLEQSRELLARNEPGITVTVMAPPAGWPERSSADYVRFALAQGNYDNPLDDLRTSLLKGQPTPEAIDNLEAVPTNGALYIVLPEQVWAYNAYIGLFPPGALESLVEQLSQRPNWTRVIEDEDTLAFKYAPPRR
ncbi:hypothetical protein [Mycobacterium sp. 360MFTsu5.1]|uniref:hypothetical protein n=1 Tax=Mycobacterium sp. 360MFTsu5.1 TaxID=1172186 RepID=UPI0012DC1E2D|nr:hypothetical protein [Mycobacterium sp. 360MFTsu5.1]